MTFKAIFLTWIFAGACTPNAAPKASTAPSGDATSVKKDPLEAPIVNGESERDKGDPIDPSSPSEDSRADPIEPLVLPAPTDGTKIRK